MVRLRLLIIVVMLVMFTGKAGAEQFIPDPDVQGKINDARQDITLKGKIAYAKEFGGYFFQTETGRKQGNFKPELRYLKEIGPEPPGRQNPGPDQSGGHQSPSYLYRKNRCQTLPGRQGSLGETAHQTHPSFLREKERGLRKGIKARSCHSYILWCRLLAFFLKFYR